METLKNGSFTGERALFGAKNLRILSSAFYDGESPLKESKDIEIDGCSFHWKYPLWYCENIKMTNSVFSDGARAGIWYTENISVEDAVIQALKTFRRAKKITLSNVSLPNAQETLWQCDTVSAKNVTARGDYFAMNIENAEFSDFNLSGNYSFDGAKNVVIKNSRLISKDAFWNSENVRVENSFISGEYLGWNSENLTLVNCTVESHQGLCYAKNLKMENCLILNTDLAFEYSTVDASLRGRVESIKNPSGGVIRAEEIGEIIMEEEKINPSATKIIKG